MLGEDAMREPLGVGPVWAMRWLVALWVASVARGSARSSLDALFSSLGQAYHAQRRLVVHLDMCAWQVDLQENMAVICKFP